MISSNPLCFCVGEKIIRNLFHKLRHRVEGEGGLRLGGVETDVSGDHECDGEVSSSPGCGIERLNPAAETLRLAEHGEIGEMGVECGSERSESGGNRPILTNLENNKIN